MGRSVSGVRPSPLVFVFFFSAFSHCALASSRVSPLLSGLLARVSGSPRRRSRLRCPRWGPCAPRFFGPRCRTDMWRLPRALPLAARFPQAEVLETPRPRPRRPTRRGRPTPRAAARAGEAASAPAALATGARSRDSEDLGASVTSLSDSGYAWHPFPRSSIPCGSHCEPPQSGDCDPQLRHFPG